jgi:hypothetical protein
MTLTAELLVLFLVGPSLCDWHLTGHHRLTRGPGSSVTGFVKAG